MGLFIVWNGNLRQRLYNLSILAILSTTGWVRGNTNKDHIFWDLNFSLSRRGFTQAVPKFCLEELQIVLLRDFQRNYFVQNYFSFYYILFKYMKIWMFFIASYPLSFPLLFQTYKNKTKEGFSQGQLSKIFGLKRRLGIFQYFKYQPNDILLWALKHWFCILISPLCSIFSDHLK